MDDLHPLYGKTYLALVSSARKDILIDMFMERLASEIMQHDTFVRDLVTEWDSIYQLRYEVITSSQLHERKKPVAPVVVTSPGMDVL